MLALACGAAPFSYSTVKVAEGIYAFVEPPGHAIVSGNTTVIVGEEGVAVVDSGHHPALTRRMVEEIRALTPKPVLFVVNTHWHNDHVAGNFVYAEAFPGARFVAHRFTAELMDAETRVYQGPSCQPFIRTQSKALREAIASGVALDGKPLTDARRARYESIVADADAGIEECPQFRYKGIDLAFEDRVTLRLGKRDVQVAFLGRANTAGDAVVIVPDARVAAVGDLLVHPFPFAFQSYIGEWAAVLRRIEAMDLAAIVPGHGPVMRDKEFLVDVATLLEAADSQVRAAYRPGATLEEVRRQVDLSKLKAKWSGDDALRQAGFDGVAGSVIARAYQAAKGALEPEGLPRF